MTAEEFKETLVKAVSGDKDAIEAIIEKYKPLINNKSMRNGVFDEDLNQYILLCIIRNISKFKI